MIRMARVISVVGMLVKRQEALMHRIMGLCMHYPVHKTKRLYQQQRDCKIPHQEPGQ